MEELIGQVSNSQIEAWKRQYGELFELKVGGHVCYLKRPSRKAIGYASVASKDNLIRFNEVILEDCFVGGSEAIKKEDKLFFGASSQIAALLEVEQSTLGKL